MLASESLCLPWLFKCGLISSKSCYCFFPFDLLISNRDITPWLLYKGSEVKLPEVPSQYIHMKSNLGCQVELRLEGGCGAGTYRVSMILWNGNYWPHFTDEKTQFRKLKLTAQGHTMPKQIGFRARKPRAKSWLSTNTFSTVPCYSEYYSKLISASDVTKMTEKFFWIVLFHVLCCQEQESKICSGLTI